VWLPNQCVLYTERMVFFLTSKMVLSNLHFRSLRYDPAGESFPFVIAAYVDANVWMRTVTFQGNARSNFSASEAVVTKGLVVQDGAKVFCDGAASLRLCTCVYVCAEARCASGHCACSLNCN
jgi:hypothetical protein